MVVGLLEEEKGQGGGMGGGRGVKQVERGREDRTVDAWSPLHSHNPF